MLSLAELGIGSAIVYALYKPLAENDQELLGGFADPSGHAHLEALRRRLHAIHRHCRPLHHRAAPCGHASGRRRHGPAAH